MEAPDQSTGLPAVAPDLRGDGLTRPPGKRPLVCEDSRHALCEVLRVERNAPALRLVARFLEG